MFTVLNNQRCSFQKVYHYLQEMSPILADRCSSSVSKNDYRHNERYVTLLALGLNKKTKRNYIRVRATHTHTHTNGKTV